jgi:hypothetical protein
MTSIEIMIEKGLWGSTPPESPNDQAPDGDEDNGQEPLVKKLLHAKNQPLRGNAARGVQKGIEGALLF